MDPKKKTSWLPKIKQKLTTAYTDNLSLLYFDDR